MPHSSLRPKNKGARRCGQYASTRPTLPSVSRKAIRSSPKRRTRKGAPSRSGSSVERHIGHQKRRRYFPHCVPGPTRVTRSFSSTVSILIFSSFFPRLDRNVNGGFVAFAADDLQRAVDLMEADDVGRDQVERVLAGFHGGDGELDRFVGMAAHA